MHHLIEDDEVTRALQLKQCRSDFYIMISEHIATKVFIGKDFTIKSAYDSDQRHKIIRCLAMRHCAKGW